MQNFPKTRKSKPHSQSFSTKLEICQALFDPPLFSVLKLSHIISFESLEFMTTVNSEYLENFQIVS